MFLSRYSCPVVVATLVLAAGCGSGTPSTPTPVVPDAPTLACPADVSRTSPNDTTLTVAYQVPSAVGGSLPVSVACTPAGGSEFPLGTTAVKCTATDALSRVATCGFNVKVAGPPKLLKTRFLSFGDSMTVGVVSIRPGLLLQIPAPTSYPGRLQVLLADRYTSQTVTIDDEGIQGEKARSSWSRLRGLLLTSSPEVVLIMEGANDINDAGTDAIAGVEDAIDMMVVSSIDAGAVPFLAGLPPQRVGGYNAVHPDAVEPFNARMKSVAEYRGITYVDVFAAFKGTASTDLIGIDGLHPTEAGYQVMAGAFYDAIKAKLEAPAASSVAFGRSLRK
jgi:lysophospholipase L1-like esterase